MSKKTTLVQDSAAALHSPEAERIERDQMRANRANAPGQKAEAESVAEAARSNAAKNATVSTGSQPRLSGLRRKLGKSQQPELEVEESAEVPQKSEAELKKEKILSGNGNRPEPLFQPIQRETRDNSTIKQGDLSNAIRLETGKDKILVNHRKMTNKITDLLKKIEAEESYLDTLAQKVTKKKHLGIVIDLPQRRSTETEHQDEEGDEFAIGYLLDSNDDKKSGKD